MAPRSKKRLVKKPKRTGSARTSARVSPIDVYRVMQIGERGVHLHYAPTRKEALAYRKDLLGDDTATVTKITVDRSKDGLVKLLNEVSAQF